MPTAKKQLKLGAYLSPGGHQAGWRHPDASPNALMDFELVAHMATTAERGKMDAVFFPDSAGMAGSTELDNGNLGRARRGRCVYIEPATLLAGIAARTSRIGLRLRELFRGIGMRCLSRGISLRGGWGRRPCR